ncbi:MAG: phage tail tape measure protein, partial [Porticoccus sp.]
MAEKLKQTIEFQAKGIQKLKGQYKDLERRTKGLEGSTKGASGSMAGMAAKLGLTTIALYGVSRAISGAVRVGKEFEKNMSNVAAISGAAGTELAALEQNAKNLGSTTVFTASQVAGLQVEFAKLGFSSKEIQGVTKDTLALASATGADLSVSAAVAGQTLRAFGLDVSETGTVTDAMAASFSSSALDMDKFSNSMQYVAPIAKQVGCSVQETTAILGTLANAGISGSMAG